MKKRAIDIMFAASFVLFAALVFLFTFIRERETFSYYENRNLAVLPEMTADGMLDGSSFSALETYLSDHAPGRNTALKLRTWTDLYLLRRPVVNDVVVLHEKNLLLPYNPYDYEAGTLNTAYIESCAEQVSENLASHADLTRSYGGYFCYAAVPCQYVSLEDEYPSYLNNRSVYTDRTTNALFSRLEEKNVPYLDMAALWANQEGSEDYCSAVDNHYSILGAFDLYRTLIEKINTDTMWELSVPQKEDFVFEELVNPYLGSRGRKLCGIFSSDEHLWRIDPGESIPFRRSMGDMVLAETVYSLPTYEWEELLYTMYMGGDLSETCIETNREALPTVLVYGDSFTNALECVLWTGFDTMYSYDFRHYNKQTLNELIEAYKPDVVICVRDYEQLCSPWANGQ